MAIKIVVLERGWVVVGHYQEDGDWITINGAVIRVWGTSKGLPELINGPKKETILDKASKPMKFLKANTILIIDAEEDKWSEILK